MAPLTVSDALSIIPEIGGLILHALDTLPLPLLIVFFLVCLALLQLPRPTAPLLPTSSPTLFEKAHQSPLVTTFPTRFPPLPHGAAGSPVFVPAVDPSGRPHYVAVSPDDLSGSSSSSTAAASGAASPPRLSLSASATSRRGSKQNWYRGGVLGVLQEEPGATV